MSDLTKRLQKEEDNHVIGYPGPRRDVAELLRAAREEIDRLTAALAEARDKALDEAANEADAMAKRRFTKDMREMLNLCAAAIRALKEKP